LHARFSREVASKDRDEQNAGVLSEQPTIANPESGSPLAGLLKLFRPAPAIAAITADSQAIQQQYRAWQRRVLLSSIIGYAVFYFVRKNLSIAMPVMEKELGISKASLGLFLTLHGVLYGVSKFANGFLGDRSNARIFMTMGLVCSALLNLCFGFSSTVISFGLFWMLNGWFQGMGFPPCARLLTHWFPPKQLATKLSIWNMSHSIGAGVIVVLCGYLVAINWRLCFLVPAGIALACSFFLWARLPDTPASVGLPEVEGTESREESQPDFRAVLMEKVFRNNYIWLVSGANFFVYTIRYVLLDWSATFLTQTRHVAISHAGWMVAGFEFSGLLGALLGGWITDRFFGGRAARACVFYMAFSALSLVLFWRNETSSELVNTGFLCLVGFFIYGPQCLVAVIAANLATKRAAASAVGLTGLFGYASTLLSGVGLGTLVQHFGWDAGFIGLLFVAVMGMVLFILAWSAKPHGYAA
jgi:OPA family glycerol-3-phosphate transporter-like MFS transporter/OPA family sugar phosphate sensor protein UhpC-like MFS transporter